MLLFLPQRLFQSVSIWFVDFVGDVFADPGATLVQLEWCILLRHLLHANQYLHGDSDGLLQTNEYKWAGLYAAKTTGPPHWMQAARSRVTAGLKWLFLAVALGVLRRLFCVRRIRLLLLILFELLLSIGVGDAIFRALHALLLVVA